MEARVKATGEIVDGKAMVSFHGDDFYLDELEFLDNNPDYWTRLEHQYAGMAMQGMIRTVGHDRMYPPEKIVIYAEALAHALVQKLKEKEERK